MTAPDQVHGAWRRRCVSIDGSVDFETQDVVWIQAGPCYADLRVPFHRAAAVRCFAGRAGWRGDEYRWTHTIDLEGSDALSADDVGKLSWLDGAMVETGMFPTERGAAPYREEWTRLPGCGGSWAAHEGPGACLVRVGGHAIVAADGGGDFKAAYWERTHGAWRFVRGIGATTCLPSPGRPVPWPLVARGVAAAGPV